MSKPLPFHPLADLFPLIEGAEFAELVADIAANGLRVPIVTIEGEAGPVILDGRNRYRACIEAGVEPRFESYTGDDPAGFVASINLKRRHMTESQRAIVAGRLATMPAHRPGKSANLPTSAMSQPEAAKMLNVSDRSVRTARTVLDKGTPALVKKVEGGEVSVSAAAAIAKAPKETQDAIAALPAKEIKTAAKVIRKEPKAAYEPPPKLLAKMEELDKAEAKAAEIKKSRPSKEEALALSKRDRIWYRAKDGKDYFWSDPKDEKKLDVWLWFKPSVEPLSEPRHTPEEVIASLDPFWVPRVPAMADAAIAYIQRIKAEWEKAHGAPQAPEVVPLPIRDVPAEVVEAAEPVDDNVIPLGDRLDRMPTERELEREAEAEQAMQDALDEDVEFDETSPTSRARVVFHAINLINGVRLRRDDYWGYFRFGPHGPSFLADAKFARETLELLIEEYEAHERGRK